MGRNVDPRQHAALIRYLLDQLTEEERTSIEKALLVDQAFQEDLAVAEEELVDRYVRKSLTAAELRVVNEKLLGSPDWQSRIQLARAMNRAEAEWAGSVAAPRSQFWGAMIAATVLVAIVAAWFAFQAGESNRRNEPLARHSTPVVASFLLTPTVRNAGQTQPNNRVILPARPGRIEIRLPLERDFYPAYQVELHSLATGATFSLGTPGRVREADAVEVRVVMNSAVLRPGRYTIVLQAAEPGGGMTEVAGFSFEAMK